MTFSIERFRLDGKVAIVTGAGGRGNGIGRAYAAGLAAAGAAVVAADINAAGAESVAQEIRDAGGRAIAAYVDVSDAASVRAMAEAAIAAFGGIDILVNNAALMAELGVLKAADIAIAEWDRILAVNLTGALICAQAVIPAMRARGGGRIVNQLSAGAFPANSIYGVGKLALLGLTTTLARQLGREGITCNAIAPGNVASEAGTALVPDGSPAFRHLESMVATRLRGQPDELVGTLLLLCAPAGEWITGQVMHVDGGWVMRP